MSRPDTILRRLTSAADELPRHPHDVAQQAVDAVPHPQAVDLRLDVDVAGAARTASVTMLAARRTVGAWSAAALEVVIVGGSGVGVVGDVRQLGVLLEDRPRPAELVLDLRVGATTTVTVVAPV